MREFSGSIFFPWGICLREIAIAVAKAVWLTAIACGAPAPAAFDGIELSVTETEHLVRARHYEGIPVESLGWIGAEGCARLVDMLADLRERRSHAEILLGIGHCRPDGGLEAIAAWADQPREGEIDRATFRAWQALPFALAALAEEDPRAVEHLSARLQDESVPRWPFRHPRGGRLATLQRPAAANLLADTDHPDTEAARSSAASWDA